MATENIMMYCVTNKGADRQVLHEAIRRHSFAAVKAIKEEGTDNDLAERILADKLFDLTREELDKIMDVHAFTGIAERQVDDFVADVDKLLKQNKDFLTEAEQVRV